MKSKLIGSLEEATLLAIRANGSNACVPTICATMRAAGALGPSDYNAVTIKRLCAKGFVEARPLLEAATCRNRARTYYSVTGMGKTMLAIAQVARDDILQQSRWRCEDVTEARANELLCQWGDAFSCPNQYSTTYYSINSHLNMLREETHYESGGVEVEHYQLYTQSNASIDNLISLMSARQKEAYQNQLVALFPAGPLEGEHLPHEKSEAALRALELI